MSEQRIDSGAESAVSADDPGSPLEDRVDQLDNPAADSDATTEGARHLQETNALAQEAERTEQPSASASPGGADADGNPPSADAIPARSVLGGDQARDGARLGAERIEGSSRQQ